VPGISRAALGPAESAAAVLQPLTELLAQALVEIGEDDCARSAGTGNEAAGTPCAPIVGRLPFHGGQP